MGHHRPKTIGDPTWANTPDPIDPAQSNERRKTAKRLSSALRRDTPVWGRTACGTIQKSGIDVHQRILQTPQRLYGLRIVAVVAAYRDQMVWQACYCANDLVQRPREHEVNLQCSCYVLTLRHESIDLLAEAVDGAACLRAIPRGYRGGRARCVPRMESVRAVALGPAVPLLLRARRLRAPLVAARPLDGASRHALRAGSLRPLMREGVGSPPPGGISRKTSKQFMTRGDKLLRSPVAHPFEFMPCGEKLDILAA